MTHSVFYDLETSDTEPVGQILNFCFIHLDDDWREVAKLTGKVRISRLQLPRAGAILANRIDVCSHQEEAEFDEPEAMKAIEAFFKNVVEHCGEYKAVLVGYNSARFDLNFLRTSLIRNGINPYFKVQHRDLLHLSRYLSISNEEFPRVAGEDPEKLSLRLETLTREHGLLEGVQAHESEADVWLTIELAKTFLDRYGADIRSFEAYQAGSSKPGTLRYRLEPNYDLSDPNPACERPMVLLDADRRYSLWIDLEHFGDLSHSDGHPRDAVRWFKHDGRDFFRKHKARFSEALRKLSQQAIQNLSGLTLKNYFQTSDCDIEQDIYRIDFSQIDLLAQNFWEGKSAKLPSKEATQIQTRFKMRTYRYGGSSDKKLDQLLVAYATYRYGGKLKLVKYLQSDPDRDFHPTYLDLIAEIEAALAATRSSSDNRLLKSLLTFYKKSDIYRVAGAQLEKIQPARAA